jgi:D-3-phosphoglycerate dehydrogenase
MRKILLTKKLSEADARLFDGIPDLDFVTVLEGEREKFDFHMRDAEAVLLSTAYEVKQEVMEKAEALKVISRTGVGVDNVDVPFATKKRVLVLHTPDANSLSVAEHTVTLIASLAKQNVIYDRELRAGNFQIRRSNKSADLVGKTLGLVGCGRIGRLAAEKCRAAFDMHIIGFDPYLKEVADITLFDNLEDVFRNAI